MHFFHLQVLHDALSLHDIKFYNLKECRYGIPFSGRKHLWGLYRVVIIFNSFSLCMEFFFSFQFISSCNLFNMFYETFLRLEKSIALQNTRSKWSGQSQ
jgi:hypothetical protein